MFEHVQPGPDDPMFRLKKEADADTSEKKVDLGVGIYRDEEGHYHELMVVQRAKKILEEKNLGHDYELTIGNVNFLEQAARVMFGNNQAVLDRVSSVQTISGTGANHLGAMFLRRCSETSTTPQVFNGAPTWGNHDPLFRLGGFDEIKTYSYYDRDAAEIDFATLLQTAQAAPRGSIFILQACCHNPTGADLTQEQWRKLANVMKVNDLFPFFDIAYQGLGGSLEDDAYPIRLFAEMGFEMAVCQSFSKNFGLYGERCGVLHIVCADNAIAANVQDQLRCLIRWEFSSSPAYGSRLVSIILENHDLEKAWRDELLEMRSRLEHNRKSLYKSLEKTPGNWQSIITTTGLFCFLPLSAQQCWKLRNNYHIYLPDTGRINLAGINNSNVEYVAASIAGVVRDP
ncbi:pyridoxal phosphate-dependent transferase [Aspergillus heterothallicus]